MTISSIQNSQPLFDPANNRPRLEMIAKLPSDPGRCNFVPRFIKDAAALVRQAISKPTPAETPRMIQMNPDLVITQEDLGPNWNHSIQNFKTIGNTLFLEIEHDGPGNAPVILTTDGGVKESNPPQRDLKFRVIKEEGAVESGQKTRLAMIVDLNDPKYKPLTQDFKKVALNFWETDIPVIWKKAVEREISNPDLLQVENWADSPSSWSSSIEDIEYDRKTRIATIDIEHNGPKDAKIVLKHDRMWLKSNPPQKCVAIHISKTSDEESAVLRRVRIKIDFNDRKYTPILSECPYKMHFSTAPFIPHFSTSNLPSSLSYRKNSIKLYDPWE